ncbi:MAG TPA: PIG-L deacetylase family protein [Candidatus Acidoferrum sp.]|jgi:LmbE family N-acetylglucosaminyl deacetylase|nr:PIG-L deacetylase family protein [Candidatus Acidoferrum sp.]
MKELSLKGIKNVLCLGAHSDDIEIGCGATILKLVREQPELAIWWVVFTADGPRQAEAEKSARMFLRNATNVQIIIKQFRNGYFPFEGALIKDFFETLKSRVSPDLIFTHFRDDRHQDHRLISDLTWNTYRNHLVLEYEIPKYDGDLVSPNVYISVSPDLGRRKVAGLMRHFQSQTNKHWFTEETFWALLRLRGLECASPYAEAFHSRKMTLKLS